MSSVIFSICDSELDSEKTTEHHQQAAASATATAATLFLPTFFFLLTSPSWSRQLTHVVVHVVVVPLAFCDRLFSRCV